ncbi:hypothetical protein IHE44_0004081 [Lamprotornis superbus]|uniref:Uncharacterized protein n=1 Tax=Lamprotornis superbus TaxID=245042 RepID=A0A835TPT0_9PASS|nr:hypothetical protein IHE44_0004081 [Lamprotornis superbus]
MDTQCYPGACQVVPVWKLVAMWPSEKEENIILISDDDDDEGENSQGSSVLFVEPQDKSPLEEKKSEELVDEEGDLVVTYCKQANVMPHGRHDCTTHPFEYVQGWAIPLGLPFPSLSFVTAAGSTRAGRRESDACSPLGKNADFCDQCYCYICDKLAAECLLWTAPSLCHCNAHNKSNFWKAQRNFSLAGVLATFNLELLELDTELRHGGGCCVPKNLGLFRITTRLQRMLVLCDFPKILYEKFVEFFQSISLPCHCYAFSNSLNVLPWDHVLLTTVLKGQNITGQRRQKGRKMFLWEALPVVEARVQKLLEKKKYKEVVRYLRAVKCNENQREGFAGDLLEKFIKDLSVAYNKYLTGERFCPPEHECCCQPKLPPGQCSVCSSQSMEVVYKYSDVFELVTRFLNQAEQESPKAAAVMLLGAARQIALHKDPALLKSCQNLGHTNSLRIAVPFLFQRLFIWGSPLRSTVLIKQALKLLYSSEALYRSAKCWSSFIMILGSSDLLEKRGNLLPLSLGEPPLGFQENVLAASGNFLEDLKSGVNVSLPSALFSGQLHHEASLILAVQAVQQTLCCDLPHLTSFLEIVLAFGKNFWALRLLLDQLACEEHILCGTANLLLRDLSREKATMLRGLRQLPFGTTVHHEVSKFRIQEFSPTCLAGISPAQMQK